MIGLVWCSLNCTNEMGMGEGGMVYIHKTRACTVLGLVFPSVAINISKGLDRLHFA